MKLLIVDDSALIRRSIASVYQGTTFTEIHTASDGLLALTIFQKHMPDVVTLDITMPNMDGLSALTKMLKIKPETLILVISALADHHTAIESLTRGATQFICKPFTPEDLKEALDDIMEDINEVHHSNSSKDLTIINHNTNDLHSVIHNSKPKDEDYPSGFVEPPSIK